MGAWTRFKECIYVTWDFFVENLRIYLVFCGSFFVVIYLVLALWNFMFIGNISNQAKIEETLNSMPAAARYIYIYGGAALGAILTGFLIAGTWSSIKFALEGQKSSIKEFIMGGLRGLVPVALCVLMMGVATFGATVGIARIVRPDESSTTAVPVPGQEKESATNPVQSQVPAPQVQPQAPLPSAPTPQTAPTQAPGQSAAGPAVAGQQNPGPQAQPQIKVTGAQLAVLYLLPVIMIILMTYILFYCAYALVMEKGWLKSMGAAGLFFIQEPGLALLFIGFFILGSILSNVIMSFLKFIPPLMVFVGCFFFVFLCMLSAVVTGGETHIKFLGT